MLTILCDSGSRYVNKFWSAAYMHSVGVLPTELYDITEENEYVDIDGRRQCVGKKKKYSVRVEKVRALTVDDFLKP